MTGIAVAGVTHRTAPVEVRERFALGAEGRSEVARRVLALAPVREAVVLSTCNRTEVFAAAAPGQDEALPGMALIDESPAGNGADPRGFFRLLEGHEALAHVLSVSAGLDSMVLGETQILGQVRHAYEEAVAAGQVGPVFRRLFPASFRVAKKAHTLTEISCGAASVGSVAVELAGKVFEDLSRSTVLLLGAGDTAATIAKTLVERRVKRLLISGRGEERARALAERLGGQALPFEDARQSLAEADVILTAAAPLDGRFVLGVDEVQGALPARRVRQLLIIDVGVPRNVDPRVAGLADVFLYDLDDLQSLEEATRRRRQREVPKVERFVAQEIAVFREWWSSARSLGPLLRALHQRFDEILGRELDRTLPRLPEEYRGAVEVFSRSLVDKLLQAPTIRLRQGGERLDEMARLVRELFDLQDGGRGDAP